MAKVLITGGSGTVGKRLAIMLKDDGFEVAILTRSKRQTLHEIPCYQWNPEAGFIDPNAMTGLTHIVHLAGADIAKTPWTESGKKLILESRVKTAEFLLGEVKSRGITLKHFISASAIGWYPMEITDQLMEETAAPGKGYLADVCQHWEAAADRFAQVSTVLTKMRIGLVLDRDAGVLNRLMPMLNLYIGAPLGSGRQAMNWIHIEDLCRMFLHVVKHRFSGVYNAVGPEPARNDEFMQTLADVTERPMLLPNAPEFVVRFFAGAKADLVLKGAPVSSAKIRSTGFYFEYPTLNTALSHVYRN